MTRVKVPLPVFIRPPLPEMTPENVVEVSSPTVSVPPPNSTCSPVVVPGTASASEAMVCEQPPRSNVAPLAISTAVVSGRAPPSSPSVPPRRFVVPLYVLAAARIIVPVPAFVRPASPETTPPKASVAPPCTSKLGEAVPVKATAPATVSAPGPTTCSVSPAIFNDAKFVVPPQSGSSMEESAVTLRALGRLNVPLAMTAPGMLPKSIIALPVSAPEYWAMIPAPPPAWAYWTVTKCSPGVKSMLSSAVCIPCGPSSFTTCVPST